MKIYGVVYLLVNMLNGKMYVGKTTNSLKERFNQHASCKTTLIGKAIHKHKRKNFRCEVLVRCSSKSELDAWEKFFITALHCKAPYGYNLTDGGDGAVGCSRTEETRAKISAALTGRHLSLEHRQNISTSKRGENNPNYGKHRSEETKAKLRMVRLGEKNPQYGKPAPNRGKKHTEATKAKMRGKRNFTEKNKEALVKILGKPIEYLFAGD